MLWAPRDCVCVCVLCMYIRMLITKIWMLWAPRDCRCVCVCVMYVYTNVDNEYLDVLGPCAIVYVYVCMYIYIHTYVYRPNWS